MTTALWLSVGVAGVWAVWRVMARGGRRASAQEAPWISAEAAPRDAPHAPEEAAELPPIPPRPLPEALALLRMREAAALPPEKLEWFAQALREVPRPPRALHQLVSIEFVSEASSSQLADVVMSEPLVAAKVLARVHSPIYGLREPVTKVGQAITYLGMTTVRNVCLRYLLDESFKSDNPQVRQVFDSLGEASSLGSELAQRLGQRLRLRGGGDLMTQVLLCFAGHMAATVLQAKARRSVLKPALASFAQRTHAQQQDLGLCGAEIGRLLMQEWQLPAPLVEAVARIDRALLQGPGAWPPAQAALMAVGYLSARLGERMADGRLDDLARIDEWLDTDPDLHHLNDYLALPALRDLRAVLRHPDTFAGLIAAPVAEPAPAAA